MAIEKTDGRRATDQFAPVIFFAWYRGAGRCGSIVIAPEVRIDWAEYSRVHASSANLLIHLFAVPLFIVSILSLVKYVLRGDWLAVVIVVVCAVFAMALQGKGHKKEAEPPRPFTGPANFLRRWFTEQFVIFPLFFLSGRWWRQYQAAEIHREP